MEIKANEIRSVVDEYHFVDKLGNVYSKKARAGKIVPIFKMKTVIIRGYEKVSICGKQYSVHRLVALAYCDKDVGKCDVNHIDGNKLNNNFKNLEWVTKSENMIHAFSTGLARARTSDRCNFTKIDECKALTCYTLKMSGIKVKDIANFYKVTTYCISRIVNGHRSVRV